MSADGRRPSCAFDHVTTKRGVGEGGTKGAFRDHVRSGPQVRRGEIPTDGPDDLSGNAGRSCVVRWGGGIAPPPVGGRASAAPAPLLRNGPAPFRRTVRSSPCADEPSPPGPTGPKRTLWISTCSIERKSSSRRNHGKEALRRMLLRTFAGEMGQGRRWRRRRSSSTCQVRRGKEAAKEETDDTR